LIQFGSDYIDVLNRQYTAGKFLKAVIFTENISPLVNRFWVDHEEGIVYQGNTYVPLHMFWNSIKASMGMSTEGSAVAISNVGNIAVKYLKEIDPSGMPVVLQLLHIDLLTTLTNPYTRYFKVIGVSADESAAVFTLGRELGKNKLPRELILADEAS